MSDLKPVRGFKVHTGEPIVIDITMEDGRSFEGRVTLAILQILEKDVPERPDVPHFEVKSQVVFAVQAKGGTNA